MAEAAENTTHLKDDFLAAVSHELRTPLNAILGWARMLGSKHLPPARAEHAIAAIERSASAMAIMIDDLLDVSRIVKGTLRLAMQPVDLVVVVQAALDAVRPSATTKHVHLAFTRSPGAHTVSGDAGRLEQVILNLLTNAIKFTPEGGRVGAFITSSNDHTEIRVVDTGQGIGPDLLPHVFERFRQADDATTHSHHGLGLGLAIVRELVELHGGTVHAASPGVGRGATFTVRLPAAAGFRGVMNNKVGVWIDHKKAVVVSASEGHVSARTLESDVDAHPHCGGQQDSGGEKKYEDTSRSPPLTDSRTRRLSRK